MAIMRVYLTRARVVAVGCRSLPRDRRELIRPGAARSTPPAVHVPLAHLDAHGVTRAIHGTLGPARRRPSGVLVTVASRGFSIPHLSVPREATVTWRFPEPIAHDVTFASGPRAVGALATDRGDTVTVQLRVPGRYKFFCSLHPMTMHQVIDVGGQ